MDGDKINRHNRLVHYSTYALSHVCLVRGNHLLMSAQEGGVAPHLFDALPAGSS